MNGMLENLAEKIQTLSPGQIAEVEDFVDFLLSRAKDRELSHAGAQLSNSSFSAVWSNPEDDVYDAL